MDDVTSSRPPLSQTWKSGHCVPMFNVQRSFDLDELHRDFKRLQEEDLFTDTELISGDGRSTRVHSLVLVSSSEFLKQWIESSVATLVQHTIILPDVSSLELEYFVSILYGVDVALPKTIIAKLLDLMDLLCISIDLPFLTEDRGSAAAATSSSAPDYPPICCWHCNTTWPTVEELERHMQIHQGEIFKRKHHKCQQCKKVFPSMWKLRQHLTHHRVRTAVVPTTEERSQPQVESLRPSDHPYANPSTNDPQLSPEKRKASAVSSAASEAKRTDHLYSARKLSKKEVADLAAKKEHQIQMKKSDHLYSTPSSPSSPTNAAAVAASNATTMQNSGDGADKRSFRLETKRKLVQQSVGHGSRRRRDDIGQGGKRERSKGKLLLRCVQCDKEFPQPYRLNRHVREVHIKERRHSCQWCDKTFFKLTSKERHELTHTEHDIWKCERCSKVFRDQSSLNYHTNKSVCLKRAERSKK